MAKNFAALPQVELWRRFHHAINQTLRMALTRFSFKARSRSKLMALSVSVSLGDAEPVQPIGIGIFYSSAVDSLALRFQ
jgi:hypothetical protein